MIFLKSNPKAIVQCGTEKACRCAPCSPLFTNLWSEPGQNPELGTLFKAANVSRMQSGIWKRGKEW